MDVTLYNAMVSGSMADTVIQTLFGFRPQIVLPQTPPQSTPLVNPQIPRGFYGTLTNVPWNGALYTITSDAINGLSFQLQA